MRAAAQGFGLLEYLKHSERQANQCLHLSKIDYVSSVSGGGYASNAWWAPVIPLECCYSDG